MSAVEGAGLKTKQRTDHFEVFRVTAPLLYKILSRLREEAPEMLEEPSLRDAIFVICLIRWTAFTDSDSTFPEGLNDDTIYDTLTKCHRFWSRHRDRAFWIRRSNGKDEYVWPYIERALRHLHPSLPAKLRLPADLRQCGSMFDRKERIYLATLTTLFIVVTRRE